ncbi:filamentous hemagglutinin N-terminal domain-containing protein [Polynucleobacter paneuropaeus]|nr:filamentous hemagglutinin N-terminal domain-containing protein [Polynucleobacter paneuropaeus]MBT8533486.1 filamentous hemagglutinin N-terminal domain-containing protein [Polynucleobacter paneuropaeus]
MERSLLSSNHPEKQFDVKLPMAGKVFALVCLFALSTQFALAQNKIAVNALPTGGNVVAGAATISSTSTAKSATMNINQTSQRAVINWQTFNVGKNATVNFNQPNSGSVTLNRVVSATPSMIQGAINANGQVILVNPNGVTFGKGAQVNAAGVVASTLNISNQDFMNGKNIYSGNGEGKIVNKGTITATDPNGYIALLAPEIRNQGYLIARMGPSSTVALASGEKISLDFRGTQLIGVSIDKAAYKALIENKRIIETNGGVIIVAAGTARELMSSVIQNTGRISANSIVDNGGVIELVADNVTNSGSISANGGTNGVGGQVNIVGNNITLAANSKTTATGNLGGGSIQVGVGKTVATNTTPASAVNGNANTAAAPQTAAQILASNTQGVGTQAQTVSVERGAVVDASAINSGNGGAIVIWSQVKTTVNGILKAVGGYLNGNGGLIETSSAGLVSLGKSLSIDTSSGKGSAGLWYVDPIDLTIDGASSAVISAALVNNNVSITVAGNTCPSLGSCTQNGSGNLTIASGADIIKQSGSLTTLTLTASGVFNLNANISGQNLDVIINSSIAYLNAGSTITANQVTVQAQTIYSYGNINSGSLSNLGSAIQLLGSALYISGNLTVGANLANSSNSTSSNSNTVSYNGTLIRQEDLPTYLAAANQTTLNLDQVYATTAANQANFTTAVNNQITLTGTESISIAATAQLLANGTTGGVIMATAPQINLVTTSNSSPSSGSQSIQGNGSLIQANGNNGPGGTISFTAANDFNINVATISANGSTDGGSIRLITSAGNLLLSNSLIQTNGGTGRGGSLGVSAANDTTINSSTLEATGFTKGGSIMVGYDSAGKSLPFSQSTHIDASNILNANQTDGSNTTDGGLIETSGGVITQLAAINAGRGGMWLLDPYDYTINAPEAAYIIGVLSAQGGGSVTISTQASSAIQGVNGGAGGTGVIYINAPIIAPEQNGGGYGQLTLQGQSIRLSADIYVRGGVVFDGPVILNQNVKLTGVNVMYFKSTVDSSPYGGSRFSLTIAGQAIFAAAVGSIAPLSQLSVGEGALEHGIEPGGPLQLFSNITTNGGSITFAGIVRVKTDVTINSAGGDVTFYGAVTSDGQDANSQAKSLTILAPGGTVSFFSTLGTGDVQNYMGNSNINVLAITAQTTKLYGNVTSTGAQTYNGNVMVYGAVTMRTSNNAGDVTITGSLGGGYAANADLILYANGETSVGTITQGVTRNIGSGFLTYVGNSNGQSEYIWTPIYTSTSYAFAAGAGGGGSAGSYAPGGGGQGGTVGLGVYTLESTRPYTIKVGLGGAGGIYYGVNENGSSGGSSSLTDPNQNSIPALSAAGGQGGAVGSGGGTGIGGLMPPFGATGGSGVQALSVISRSSSGQTPSYYANWFGSGGGGGASASTGSGSTFGSSTDNYYGWGGSLQTRVIGVILGSTAGVNGAPNSGMGGGGGAYGNYSVYGVQHGAGGAGANGQVLIHQVVDPTSSLSISTAQISKVSIGSVNGSGASGSYLQALNISAASPLSSISGIITGAISISYAGLSSTSKLTLSGNNNYVGGLSVYVGTLVANSATAFGATNNAISLGSRNSSIDLNGQSMGSYVLNIQGEGAGNQGVVSPLLPGALANSSDSTAYIAGTINVIGDRPTYIGGGGSLNLNQAIINDNGNGIGFIGYSNIVAINPLNQISTIAGNVAALNLVSRYSLTVGVVQDLNGLNSIGAYGGLQLYALSGGITANKPISATADIYLFGQGNDTYKNGVVINAGASTVTSSQGSISLIGVTASSGYGVYIGPGIKLTAQSTSNGSISISGSNTCSGNCYGSGVYIDGDVSSNYTVLKAGTTLNVAGYSGGSALHDVYGIRTIPYTLLISGGDMQLGGSTPNGNSVDGYTSNSGAGYAIYLGGTTLSSGGKLNIEGAISTFTYGIGNSISANGVAVLSVGAAANGANQAGIYIGAPGSVLSYSSTSYSNIVAAGNIWIAGSSNADSNYAFHGVWDEASIISNTGSITMIGVSRGNQAVGVGFGAGLGGSGVTINTKTNGDIWIAGSNLSSVTANDVYASGWGVGLGNNQVIDAGGQLTIAGYASGSFAGNVFGIASTKNSNTLLKSTGDMVLASSTPNSVSGNASVVNIWGSSAAINLSTAIYSGGSLIVENAVLSTLAGQNGGSSGTSIANVATAVAGPVQSSAGGFSINSYGTSASYKGVTYSDVKAVGNINIAAQGSDLGIYATANILSSSGSITLDGSASAGTGVMVQVVYSTPVIVATQSAAYGDITIKGISSGSAGSGVMLRGNGSAVVVVDAAKNLTLSGYAAGTSGESYAIFKTTEGDGLLKSGSNMIIAGGAPNNGTIGAYAIALNKMPIYAGGNLTIEGATSSANPIPDTAVLAAQTAIFLNNQSSISYTSLFTNVTSSYAYNIAQGDIWISGKSTSAEAGIDSRAQINSMNGLVTLIGYGTTSCFTTVCNAAVSSTMGINSKGLLTINGTTTYAVQGGLNNAVAIVGNIASQGGVNITSYDQSSSGVGAIKLDGSITNTGAPGITISSYSDVYMGSLTNSGSGGIRVTAGRDIAAGTTTGGTINGPIGTITNTGGVVGFSMASAPTGNCNTLAACPLASAVSITSNGVSGTAIASIANNISYGKAGGDFSHPAGYTGGNFINYRQIASVGYSVTFANNYSAVYGTAYNSSTANAWLLSNATVSLTGTAFGYSPNAAAANLRFNDSIGLTKNANIVQSNTPIASQSLSSTDGSVITLTGAARTYSITPATLTITAGSDNKNYGTTLTATSGTLYTNGVASSSGYFTVSGLVTNFPNVVGISNTGDSVATVTLTSNGGLATATVNGGPYAIVPSAASGSGLSNYTINYVNGAMNVTPAPLSVTAYNDSKVYGTTTTALRNITYTSVGTGANATGAATTTTGYSVAGLLNSDSVTGVTLSSNGGLATATVAGGPYAITPGAATGSGLSNYAIQYVNAVMQMTPASLTITASNDSKVYGATATSNNIGSYANGSITAIGSGFTVNGLLNSDSISRVILTSNGALATATVAGGPYSITPSTPTGVGLSNYSINYVNGSMSVTPAPLGISVTGVYNNSTTFAPSSFTTYGLVNGEVINTLSSATVAFKDVLTGNNYVTGLVISTGTASMNNYQLNPLGRNITQNSTLQNIATITPIEITVTGATAANKVYDGTTAAVVNTSGAILSGKISGDNLTLTMNSGSFMSPDVGTSISVSGAGSLQGSSASNYTLGATILMANITKAPLGVTVTGTYSNSTTITPTSFTTNGLVNGETIVTLTSAIVSNKNVAANGSNYVTSITKGNGTATLNNYAINTSYNASSGNTQNTATIDPKVLSVSGTAVADKVYNGTASATLTNGVLNGVNPGDSITLTQAGEFSQANVGTSVTVVARDTISDSSGNYTLQQPQTLNASITPKLVTLSATKTYDATTSLTGVVTIGGLVGSETLNYTGATAYSTNAGGVNFIAAMTLANGSNGGLASNYVLPSLGSFANAPVTITPKALNLSANKVYDATTSLTGAITINGLISGQTLNYSGATAHTANAGSTYIDAITITNGTGGGLASNYQVPTLTSAYTYNNVTINRKAITLSASKVYDGSADLAGAVSVGGLIGSQTLSYTGAIASDINVATSNKYILNIALSDGTNGGVATNYSLPVSGLTAVTAPVTITPKALTVTGTTVPDKVYDGSTTTTLAGGTLVGVVARDIGSVTLNQAGTFASPNAGTNVAVVANDSLNLTASAVGNYTLIQPTTTTGNITPKSLTVSGTTVANKVYDSTGDATLSGGSLVGLVTGDAAYVSLVQAGTFAQSNVGSAIAVTANNSLTGTKASNYALTQPTGLGADITPKSLGITVTGTYNGTNTIEVTSFTTTGLVAGEVMGSILSATVSDANVATPNKYVGSIAYITGNGARVLWMSNYSISQAYNSTVGSTQNIATITPIALTVTGTTVPNKVYDGSTATTLANGVLNGVISGQAVGLVQAGTFASPNAGNNVAVVASDSLSGNAAVLSNYTLVQPTTTTGNITPAPVTVNNTSVANKVYDGTNVATLTGGTLSGVIAGDAVNVTLNQSGAFANVNVGSGIAVTATDSLSGTKAANYTLTQPSVSSANITPAPLGISITNAVYQASTSLYPVGLNFTVTGLVHGETIATLGGATVANANVSANGSNYITAITVGSGTASLSNYSLNPSYSSATNNMQNKVTLTPMVLTVTGTTVPDKVYDGTTTITLAGGTLVGVFSTDRNNVSLNQSGTFASPNAGNNVAVVANDSLNLTASAVGNYTLIQPTTTTGNIIKALLGITVTGTYTGSTTLQASGIGFTVSGLLNNETINTLGAVTVSDKNVSANGSNYVTAITIGTGTASMNNYVLTQAYNAISGNTQNTATILTTQLTVVGTSSTTKVYDATNSATLTGGVLAGLKGSDTLTLNQLGTFSNTNVGNNLIITAADSISGTAAGNYTLIQPTGLTGSITPKALTVNGTSVPTKVYDGTTSVVFSNSATLVGVIGSDTVVLNQAGSFVSKNVGSGVAITINDSISGASASNYTLVQPTGVSANITPAPLGLTLTAVYSGSTTITPTSFTTNGLWNGDTITALSSATLSSANVSANASNYITSVTIGGGSALMSNYTINPAYNATPGNTLNTATITPKALTLSASKVYDGSTTGASVNISGLIGGQTLNYSDVRLSDQNVATANKYISAITLADGAGGGIASNYVPPSLSAASASNSVTITPLMVRLSANKEYDGTTSLTGKVTISGLVGSETLNYTGATAISPNVGANYINAIALADGTNGGLASNYQIPNLTLAYTNNNAQVTAKAISISATKVYDATADLTNAITITGLIGNQTLNYSGATANSANVLGASYINAITFTDGANGGLERNYIVPTLTGSNTNNSVSITAAPLSLSGTKIYDGSRTGGTGTLNIGGLIGAQTLSSSDVTVNDPNVGTDKYITAITLADGANGGITSNYALPNLTVASARNNGSITPRDLTITVSAQTKTYGDGIAQTSNTQDGSINLTPVSGHTSGTASNVDTRTTALSDIQYVNYTGNTANNSTAGFSVDGLVANDVVRTVNISSSGGALTANANVNGVLAYAITASGAVGTGLSNYNISYIANNYSVLTITPRKLVVTAATATMVYGASALPTLSTSSITGWANTADQAITSIALSAQDATGKLVKANIGGVAGSPVVGTYSVVATGVNGNPNYVIDTVNSTPGQFTITPASLTITANSLGGPGAPILYGTPTVLKPDAFTSSGLTNGDSLSTATITFNSATTVAGTTTPGIYTPVVSGPSSTGGLQISGASGPTFVASNYVINYVAGSLTIGQAKLTVSAVNDAKLQGQQDANGYNGVIVSGFVNGDTLSVLNTTGLSITRNNAVNNTAPGTYNGVLIASGVSLADLNSTNYSIAYQPGNFTIVPPNQLLIKVAPVTTQYGSAIYTGSSPVTATYLTSLGSSPQSINALISGGGSNYQVNLGSGQSSASAPLVIGTAADISSSGNLNVGSYNLSPIAQQINLQGTGLTSAVAVGGISITPKTLSFADLGSVTLTKDYDGKASSTVPVPALSSTFLSGDNVTATASGTFTNLITGMPDANAGINKSYTIAVSFSPKLTTPGANQTDANNYVLTGGGIYTADGGTGINHGPANGVINVLDSVTYIGAASGAAWSSASSWANGAVPTYANVRNIIVPVGFSVVYDAGVAGPVAANLQNAGNVNFNTDMGLAISMNISGAGSITISGTGQVSLSGNNTYTGNAIINNGAKLVATYGNTIGAGNIQGLGGTFQTTPGTIFTQINATGSLILASDITTTGNQTYGNITFSQPRTTLLSQFGSITINGTVDSGTANVNTLLLQAPTGSVYLRGSVGSIKPLNVLEIDAVSTYLYADVLTADQQNYCGAAGCYTAITPAQVTASYCATNDCYSKNNATSAYNLLASGTGGSGNFAKSANIGQLFIGDVGQVGFLYNKYNQYASKSVADGGFGTPTPLFNNNSVYARTLMSMDPTVNLGSYVSDVSVTPTHTIQVAAIQATGVTASPTIQMSGSGKTQSTSALYSLSALTQGATWAGTYSDSAPIEAANYIALGSKALNLNNASLTAPTLNLVYPPSGTLTTNASSSFTANNASINGRATTTIGGRSLTPYTPATPSPSGVTGARSLATPATPTTRNSFILAAVAEQTKIERKYDVDASVDVGEIETDDGPAAADDQDDKKKKKAGNQKAAQ